MAAKKEIKADILRPTPLTNGTEEAFASQFIPLEADAQGVKEVPSLIFAFDKPLGMTSFGLVAKVRWLLTRRWGVKKIKIGHAGTLDPLATGVMIICTGRATKLIERMQSGVKEYVATLRLGATTPSFDLEHEIDATYPTAHITRQLVEDTLPQFVGEIMQVPPAYSACKVGGERAYDLIRRQGAQTVELKAKPLRIDQIELTACHLERDEITLRIVCSKGTYIRALARDIGRALGSGAHLTALRRTQVGEFTEADCFSFPAPDPHILSFEEKQTKPIS